jgi:hypothetical protein
MSKTKQTALVIFIGITSLAGLIRTMVMCFGYAMSICPLAGSACVGRDLAKSDFFSMLGTYLLVMASFCIPFTIKALLKVRGVTDPIFNDDDNLLLFAIANGLFGGFTLLLGCMWLAS